MHGLCSGELRCAAEVNGRPRVLPGRPGPGRAVNRSGKRGKDARARLVDGVMEATLTAEAPPLLTALRDEWLLENL